MGKLMIAYINAKLKYGFRYQLIYREPPKLDLKGLDKDKKTNLTFP